MLIKKLKCFIARIRKSSSERQRHMIYQNGTGQTMKNLRAVLNEDDMKVSNVVKTTIFLYNRNEKIWGINEAYWKHFETAFPAREMVEVAALPKFVNVEISMIAVK